MVTSDIFIRFGANIKEAMNKTRRLTSTVRASSAQMQKSIGNMNFKKMFGGRGVQKSGKKFSGIMATNNKRLSRFATKGERVGSIGSGMADSFDAAALGVMFFGMQLQRVFTGIIRSGVKTFNEVMGKIEGTTTNADRLAGSFKFLQFQIGRAFEPILGFLAPLIQSVARFAQRNQEVVRVIGSVGAVLGGLLTTLGAVQLGIKAVTFALGPSGFLSSVGAALTKLKGFQSALSGLITTVSISFAIESASEVVQDIKDGDYASAIKNALATVLLAAPMFFSAPIGAALFAVGMTLRFVGTKTIINKWLKFSNVVVSIFEVAGEEIAENWKQGVVNTIKRGIQSILEFIMKIPESVRSFAGLDGAARKLEEIRNEAVQTSEALEESSFSRFQSALNRRQEALPDNPAEQILNGNFSGVPTEPANADTASLIQEQTGVLRQIRDLQKAKNIVRQERGFGSLEGMSEQEILDAANRLR